MKLAELTWQSTWLTIPYSWWLATIDSTRRHKQPQCVAKEIQVMIEEKGERRRFSIDEERSCLILLKPGITRSPQFEYSSPFSDRGTERRLCVDRGDLWDASKTVVCRKSVEKGRGLSRAARQNHTFGTRGHEHMCVTLDSRSGRVPSPISFAGLEKTSKAPPTLS